MKVGDRVKVWNATLSGKTVEEGIARVTRIIGSPDRERQLVMVEFEEDGPEARPVRRFVRDEDVVPEEVSDGLRQ